MKCPKCHRAGKKAFKGFCSKSHLKLSKRAKIIKLSCASCGRPVERKSYTLGPGGKAFCSRCPKNVGETHPRWREGQYLNPQGYRLILIKDEYKLEHRYTWELANNACLLLQAHGMIAIHHINMNKTDNRPENLVLLSSIEHGRIHRLIDAKRFEEAKAILLKNCNQQAFFLLHTEHLSYYKDNNLEDILVNEYSH